MEVLLMLLVELVVEVLESVEELVDVGEVEDVLVEEVVVLLVEELVDEVELDEVLVDDVGVVVVSGESWSGTRGLPSSRLEPLHGDGTGAESPQHRLHQSDCGGHGQCTHQGPWLLLSLADEVVGVVLVEVPLHPKVEESEGREVVVDCFLISLRLRRVLCREPNSKGNAPHCRKGWRRGSASGCPSCAWCCGCRPA